jgi:HrpA-like RNA helicase
MFNLCLLFVIFEQLTNLGRQLAAFPLDPRLAKVLIAAPNHQCLLVSFCQ